MIKLVYIRGISAYDTPYFSSKVEQDDFFNDIVGEEIDAYYPPHYTNTIKFDVEDVSDMSQYNYLILYTDNKTYYYFIQSIEYINETLYEITIVMDTIQTYMFDIVWNESLVSKKSIKRWNNDKINRDYIRENLSQTSKKLDYYDNIDLKDCFILQSSYNYTFDIEAYTQGGVKDNRIISNGCYYYLIPIPKRHSQYIRVRNYYNDTAGYNQYDIIGGYALLENLLATLVKDPYTINIYYVKNIHFGELLDITEYQDEDNILIWHFDLNYSSKIRYYNDSTYAGCIRIPDDYDKPTTTNQYGYLAFLIKWFNSDWQSKANIIYQNKIYINNEEFEKNSSLGIDFNKKYIPQLIDENYMELAFGERMCSTNFPLHYALTDTFKFQCIYDIYSGFRSYRLLENEPFEKDEYLTTVVASTCESLDLYNDAWLTYQAQHKGDLTIGIANQVAKNIYSAVGGTINSSSVIFRGNDNVGFKPSVGTYYGFNNTSAKMSAMNSLFSLELYKAELRQTHDNMESVPDTARCGNQFYSDYINSSIDTLVSIMVSEDIESVARKLEYHGYKVCEYIRGNLFEECKIRYYYNVIQVDNMYIDLSVLATSDILFEIKTRFNNGLRLWDMEHNSYITEGLKYDNVELEEL